MGSAQWSTHPHAREHSNEVVRDPARIHDFSIPRSDTRKVVAPLLVTEDELDDPRPMLS